MKYFVQLSHQGAPFVRNGCCLISGCRRQLLTLWRAGELGLIQTQPDIPVRVRQIAGKVLPDLLATGHSAHQQHKLWKESSLPWKRVTDRELKFSRGSCFCENREDQESSPSLLGPLSNFCLSVSWLCVYLFLPLVARRFIRLFSALFQVMFCIRVVSSQKHSLGKEDEA